MVKIFVCQNFLLFLTLVGYNFHHLPLFTSRLTDGIFTDKVTHGQFFKKTRLRPIVFIRNINVYTF